VCPLRRRIPGSLLLVASALTFAQAADARLLALGKPFLVNTSTEGDQTDPAIAVLPEGGFVIVWGGPPVEIERDLRPTVYGRSFDEIGRSLGPEFKLEGVCGWPSRRSPPRGLMPPLSGLTKRIGISSAASREKAYSLFGSALDSIPGLYVRGPIRSRGNPFVADRARALRGSTRVR
jgi:hypothetical protein